MVQVRERAEELLRAAHLVADDDTALARALDFENLDDWPVPLLHAPHNALVDLERVLARLLQKHGVGDRTDIGLAIDERANESLSERHMRGFRKVDVPISACRCWRARREAAFRNKVAPELL